MDTLPVTEPDESKTNSSSNGELADQFKHIPGWGVDADPENDPTYPMKHWNGADHQRLNYQRPPQQPVDMRIFKSIERPDLTRVFGTSTPPTGLSGVIRRFAYKYSEANGTHWMTLLLADRVDVIQGIVSDLRKGIIPNLWIEKGWRSEWKTNRNGVLRKAAAVAVITTALLLLRSEKRKSVRYKQARS